MEHTPDPQLPVYEGNLFIFVFWGTWGLFQGSIGIFLETSYDHFHGHPSKLNVTPQGAILRQVFFGGIWSTESEKKHGRIAGGQNCWINYGWSTNPA